jgi:hypothetical protein
MDNNRYELHNEENNLNINNINRNDIAFDESNQTEGNLFLPIQVENYLNVNNYYLIILYFSPIPIGEIPMNFY